MTVKELIQILEKHPPDLLVAYRCYSEYCALEADRIGIRDLCVMRDDGWIHELRPDKPTQKYLVFPGN